MIGRRSLAVIAIWAAVSGCKTRGPRSPEKLREAHVAALQRGDAKAAYALLAPEVQARVPYAEFAKRWERDAAERKEAVTAAETLDATRRAPVYEGTTVHAGGRVLRWTSVGDRYYVVDGLPGVPRTETPAQTVRSLLEAVRTTDLSRIRGLLSDELAAAIGDDWQARVEAIEAALERPGAIELSADLRQAELRYEPNRVLTMEQTPEGWTITGLE